MEHILRLMLNIILQPIQAQAIVIIHPGSKILRIGRASDLNPHAILHAIARPKRVNGPLHRDPLLIPTTPMVPCNLFLLVFLLLIHLFSIIH